MRGAIAPQRTGKAGGPTSHTNTRVDRFVPRIRQLEEEFASEQEAQRRRWNYRLDRGRVWFDRERQLAHRRFKQSIPAFIAHGSVLNLLTAPIIYTLVVPLVVLDAWITLYQWLCFPLYGIAVVSRSRYFVMDRHKLAYLNAIEKVHCTYCSYANGLIAYAREITARTEQYWCPIKHARVAATPHARYHAFLDFGDAEGYRKELADLRGALREERRTRSTHAGSTRGDRVRHKRAHALARCGRAR